VIALAEVLARHWPDYQRQFGTDILPSQIRAVQCILQCRTPAMGGEVFRCPNCGKDHYVYHSCNHRACPQCGNAGATAQNTTANPIRVGMMQNSAPINPALAT